MSEYLLIDLENVPNPDLGDVPETTHIWVFVGADQKVASTLATTLANRSGEFRKLTAAGKGRNALDMHIVYYLSQILAAEPHAQCRILADDGDYDVLLKHLRQAGRKVTRIPSPAAKQPKARPAAGNEISSDGLKAKVRKRIERFPEKHRPKIRNKLINSLLSHLKRELLGSSDPRARIIAAIDELTEKRVLSVVGNGRLSYNLG